MSHCNGLLFLSVNCFTPPFQTSNIFPYRLKPFRLTGMKGTSDVMTHLSFRSYPPLLLLLRSEACAVHPLYNTWTINFERCIENFISWRSKGLILFKIGPSWEIRLPFRLSKTTALVVENSWIPFVGKETIS